MLYVPCRCFDIFNPKEQAILKKYRKENFAEKNLISDERRAIGKCPLTPEEVIFVVCFGVRLLLLVISFSQVLEEVFRI